MCAHTGQPQDGFRDLGIRVRLNVRTDRASQSAMIDLRQESVLAAVDTGADISMLRRSVAERLGLKPLRCHPVYHFAGEANPRLYVAEIVCPCGESRQLYVVDDEGRGHPECIDFPDLLLGRDILRFSRLSLDGPAGDWRFEIDFALWPDHLGRLSGPHSAQVESI